MKEEELIKKLESTVLPEIEVQSHRRRLRMALLNSEYFKEQPEVGVFGRVSSTVKRGVDVLRGLISWRPVWQLAMVSILAIALIVSSALFIPLLVGPSPETLTGTLPPGIARHDLDESGALAKPTLGSPANGTRVGFIGKQAPTFQWLAVTDESGVSYMLQIASDERFANLVVPEISCLSETDYTLSKEQALPRGTYYWRVKAIDSAQNDSGWTAPHSFQVGLIPLWTFIAVVVVIGMFVAALVYRFALKR
jgi:hypothetical protein